MIFFDMPSTVNKEAWAIVRCFVVVPHLFSHQYISNCYGRQVADVDIVVLGMEAGADVAKVVHREDLSGECVCRYWGSVALVSSSLTNSCRARGGPRCSRGQPPASRLAAGARMSLP